MIQFDPIWSNSIQFDPIWSNSIRIQFDPIRSNLIQFDLIRSRLIQFDPIWSNSIKVDPVRSKLIQLDPFWSNLILRDLTLLWNTKNFETRNANFLSLGEYGSSGLNFTKNDRKLCKYFPKRTIYYHVQLFFSFVYKINIYSLCST